MISVDAARDRAVTKIAEMQNFLQAHPQLDVLRSEHTAIKSDGKVFCMTCTENSESLSDGRQIKSEWIASDVGYRQGNSTESFH